MRCHGACGARHAGRGNVRLRHGGSELLGRVRRPKPLAFELEKAAMMDRQTFERIDKLGVLFGLAVHDARAIVEQRGLALNMGVWVQPDEDGVCYVCMAGAVAVNSLGWPRDQQLRLPLYTLGMALGSRLRAIDALRAGRVVKAWEAIHGQRGLVDSVPANLYTVDAGQAAKALREAGHMMPGNLFPWGLWDALVLELVRADV